MANNNNIKYLLVTDIPAPWREKVYENVYKKLDPEFHVVYCNSNEKRRLWNFPLGNHPKTFLKGITISTENTKENYINWGIIPLMLRSRPEIVVCFSLNPTIFIVFAVAKLLKAKIIVFADTWLGRDTGLSLLQTWARKLAYGIIPDAYLGASRQTLNLYRYYNKNVEDERLFISNLCADNDYFMNKLMGMDIQKKYDIMFSGRIVDLKNPLFFAEVAARVKEKLGRCKVLIIGDGDEKLKKRIFQIFEEHGVDYDFPGFIKHSDLPEYYSKSRILLLPTSGDCWGVVINEAMISGVPVITTNMTAAAGELVLDGINGYVLPLDVDSWAEKIVSLLNDSEKFYQFSKAAKETVIGFNFKKASEGIIHAIEYVEQNLKRSR
jgi:glycosyltransferase involved in cell wall biosynthesis